MQLLLHKSYCGLKFSCDHSNLSSLKYLDHDVIKIGGLPQKWIFQMIAAIQITFSSKLNSSEAILS